MYLLLEEDVLIDWTQPIFLNFTHSEIVRKLEEMIFTDDAVLSQLNHLTPRQSTTSTRPTTWSAWRCSKG
nr:unnamed protein product [Callosobruchus analis]